jgi:hypothetical protein
VGQDVEGRLGALLSDELTPLLPSLSLSRPLPPPLSLARLHWMYMGRWGGGVKELDEVGQGRDE